MMPQDNRDDRKDETEKLRADAAAMLERARNQLADIQRALSSLGDDRAAHGRLAAEADRLSAIVSQLTQAVSASVFPLRGSDLVAIGSAVQSGEAHAALTEASAPAAATSAALAANVATTSAETRSETESLARDVFDQHIFDRYLHYSSAADEEESRKRQAEDKKYIAAQLARHTPEGDLNASGGMIDSMLDLHAHGAGNSPDFTPSLNAMVNKSDAQRNAMKAAGQSTKEFDDRLHTSLHRFLKDEKGLSDSESDKRLGTFANPLDAVKSFLKDDGKSGDVKGKASGDTHASLNLDDIRSKLKAAGVTASDTPDTDAVPKHGVNVQKTAAKDAATLGA
jgi:hypothetical protein